MTSTRRKHRQPRINDDPRPKVSPPPPVQLVAVADVTLPALTGMEKQLDDFYVGILHFARQTEPAEDREPTFSYRAENACLRLVCVERPPLRDDFKFVGIVVPSIAELVERLNDAGIEFIRQRGLTPGSESLVLSDPAGNLLAIGENRLIC